jgi:hypothetical protein
VWSDWREVNAGYSGMILKKDGELIDSSSKNVSGKPMRGANGVGGSTGTPDGIRCPVRPNGAMAYSKLLPK